VTAESEARGANAARTEAGPFSHDGFLAVGAHQPVKRKAQAVEARAIGIYFGNPRSPAEGNAQLACSPHQQIVQHLAAQAKCRATRDSAASRRRLIGEAHSCNGVSVRGVQPDSELTKRGYTFGEQTFAAGFVNWRPARVRYRYAKSFLTCCYRRRNPCWPRSNDQDFRACSHSPPLPTNVTKLTPHKSQDPSQPGCSTSPAPVAGCCTRPREPTARTWKKYFRRAASKPTMPTDRLL